jgi:hypothetical protein
MAAPTPVLRLAAVLAALCVGTAVLAQGSLPPDPDLLEFRGALDGEDA